jgi:NADPH:quinone reductase
MRAFAIDRFGEEGSVRDLPAPTPSEGQVRIRVVAAGVNPVDGAVVAGYLKDMMEHRFPLIPGLDASGVVDAFGAGVEGWAEGDEVFGAVGKMHFGEGSFAEQVTMSAATIARKPASIGHHEAAGVPLAGVTALMMNEVLALSDGETVVAIGASGGVGSFLVQLAAGRGATVVAVCRGENAGYVMRLGATDAIDYSADDVVETLRSRHPDGIDAIADMAGDRDGLARLAEQLRPGGRVASAVGAADQDALGRRRMKAVNVTTVVTAEHLRTLADALERGELKRPQIQALGLKDAGGALSAVWSHHVRGKLVLTLD